MARRQAFIGDVHGCIDELKELYAKLEHEALDCVWIVGDLVDRGPDSGAVVEFARSHGIHSIRGNHEAVILELYDRGQLPKNLDKKGTIESIRSEADWEYLRATPYLHVDDEANVVVVHGGLLPQIPLHAQAPRLVCRLQLIHPESLDHTYWFNMGRDGISEKHRRELGYRRWYELYDHSQDVVYGHSVFREPKIVPGSGGGTSFGIDTGCVFGGKLTALILPDRKIIQVPARREYAGRRLFEDSSFGVNL
jgi:serine/threonine protein phosphatase 1